MGWRVPVVRITDSEVRRAIASEPPGEVWLWDDDLSGFGARVASGKATFVVKYTIGGRRGRQRKVKVGPFGALNAREARADAQAILRRVARGEDPAAERDEDRAGITVAEALDQFLELHAAAKRKTGTVENYRHQIERFLKPAWGKGKVADLSTADVSKLHAEMKGTPVAANRTLALVSKFANWCELRGYRPKFSNPAKGIEKYREKHRERYLTPAEIERLSAALVEAEADEWPTAIAAIRLLLFTGARHREITTLTWDAVDMERGIARLGDTKTGARNIMLPAPALAILEALPRRPNNPHVIWGRRPGSHLVGLQNVWERVREKAGLADVRIHDLRHTVASLSVAGGASLKIVGALLGHKSPLTTNRYAHLADDPAKALADKVGGTIAAIASKGERYARKA